jgi:hypothetical protein
MAAGLAMGLKTMLPKIEPLLVSVKNARLMLGGMGHNRFWQLAGRGEFEIAGSKRKRLVFVSSIQDYIDRMPRAPYSRSEKKAADTAKPRVA